MFEALNLQVSYGKHTVLRDVSFALRPGTITALLGANGCGKTTLLKAICGILPHAGCCKLHGAALEALSAKRMALQVSYIPQRSGITIDLTALEVVQMGFNPKLKMLQQPTKAMNDLAQQTLQMLGIEAEQNYLTLSEGQKQLCILARTMVCGSDLLLLDEPESALDLQNRYEIFARLRQWMGNRTILATLHDPQLALQVCDTLVLLKDGQVLRLLHPREDEIGQMEQALSEIYGRVKLYRLDGQLVMLKQGENL